MLHKSIDMCCNVVLNNNKNKRTTFMHLKTAEVVDASLKMLQRRHENIDMSTTEVIFNSNT